MADLTRKDTRGQMILLTAFILAITFVVLALVVNSAIFTENLATRDDVPGSQDGLEYRDEVEKSLGNLVTAINQNNSREPGEIDDSVGDVSVRGGADQSTLGRVADIRYIDTESGTKIAQDSSDDFTDAGGDPDWNVAEIPADGGARNIELKVENTDSLADADEFELIADNGTFEWSMAISGDSEEVDISVTTPTGVERTCTRADADTVTIDVTAGTVDNKPCPALTQTSGGEKMWFASGLEGGYDIEFDNADNIEGTYSMIVDASSTGNINTDRTDPYETDAIYSLTVGYEFYTPEVGYGTEVRVTPGEVPP